MFCVYVPTHIDSLANFNSESKSWPLAHFYFWPTLTLGPFWLLAYFDPWPILTLPFVFLAVHCESGSSRGKKIQIRQNSKYGIKGAIAPEWLGTNLENALAYSLTCLLFKNLPL